MSLSLAMFDFVVGGSVGVAPGPSTTQGGSTAMKRILQRLVVIVGVSGGLIAAVETAANALTNTGFSLNHSEPVARDHR